MQTASPNKSPRLKLLFLLPFPPRLDAAHGGGKVIAQLMRQLMARHQVALLYLRGADEPPLDEQLQAQCAWAEEVCRPWTRLTLGEQLVRNGRLVVSLLCGRPLWVTDWHSRAFEQRACAAVAQWQPDVVQAEFHIMGQYFAALSKAGQTNRMPRVLVEHEPGQSAAPYLKRRLPLMGALHRLDRLAWKRFERKILAQAQAVVVFTSSDRAALSPLLGDTPAVVVPLGVEVPAHAANPTGRDPLTMLFVGNFLHPPNIDAADWLVRDIFPRLQAEFPSLQLVLVGDHPPAALVQLAHQVGEAHLRVTGRVPEVGPYLDAASIVVAPIRTGGGMRVKVLEALAAGKAVVATPLAAEGLAVTDGDQIALAETAEAFAGRIAALLRDPAARTSLASRARAWAGQHLGWPASAAAYEAVYRALLAGVRP